MGVKNFFKLFNGVNVNLNNLKGSKIAVDGMIEAYRSTRYTLTDKNGLSTNHINHTIMTVCKFKKFNISLIYVFDSAPVPLKAEELVKRRALKSNKIMTMEMINDIKYVLKHMGVSYIMAPDYYDAEHVCAKLNALGRVDHVLSTDADVFMYGGVSLLKNEKTLQHYTIESFEKQTGCKQEDVPLLGVILGTDFCEKTPKIGIATVVSKMKDVTLTTEQQKALNHFKSDVQIPDIEIFNPDISTLLDWLEKRNFNRTRFSKILNIFKN